MKLEPRLFPTLVLAVCVLLGPGNSQAQDKSVTGSSASLTQSLSEFLASAEKSADPALKPLGNDLGSKISAFSKSLEGNPDVQKQLEGALQSLSTGTGASSLGVLQKLTQSKLTPGQTKLAKDVYHSGSAYLVQKNFGSLPGSQSEVAQVVTSLGKGNYMESLPALKKIGENAQLTPPQKELLTSLGDQYAPGIKKVGDALKGIPGFGK